MIFDIGVCQVMELELLMIRDIAAAVNALLVLPTIQRVDGVAFVFGNSA